jgi:glucose/arabinose dehydrogenase
MATAVAAGLAVAVPSGVANAAVALPGGFLLQDTPAGLSGDLLTDFAFLPDQSMLAVGKNGRVNWIPETGQPRQIKSIPVTASGDMGLQGLAVAPDYATSRAIYTARTAPSTASGSGPYGVLRVSRWTVEVDNAGNPAGLGNEQTVLETSADSNVHGMSTVIADEDGTLWVSIGDSSSYLSVDPQALRALDFTDLHGKVLHIKPDGTGVPGNPYYNASNPGAVAGKVYASGFRSPFRFSLDPQTKQPVVGDVGWGTYEEINVLSPGNSYGWPCWEGPIRTTGYKDLPGCVGVNSVAARWAYPRSSGGVNNGSSVTGGVIYQGKNYPADYQGKYFFGDYTSKRLWTMALDSADAAPVSFGSDIGAVVKIGSAPVSGDIVFADIASGNVRRLVYAPGNNPPSAVITATNDPATRKVAFSAAKSTDPNGDELTYEWNFGEGEPATGEVVEHQYPQSPASFTVTLTAIDPLGAKDVSTLEVFPSNHTPVLTVQAPDPNRTFAVGDVIEATATATDPDEQDPLQVSWSADVIHCRGADNCHLHPGVRQDNVSKFELSFEGHPGDTRLEITAVTTDSKGASASKTFVVRPKQRRITIQSGVPAEFTIGDEQVTSGLFTVGSSLTVIAPQEAADKVATFDKWNDNSPRVRQVTVPDADVTLPVTYLTPIDRRYNSDAALRQTLGAPSGLEQGDATVRWRTYAVGRLYWSPATGAKAVHGDILLRYLEVGGHQAYGLPKTDELPLPDGRGRYNEFTGDRSIYWTQATGPKMVLGNILLKWRVLGAQAFNGYPTTDEMVTPDGIGRYNHFEAGSIYHYPGIGEWEVHGGIRDKWAALGWELSVLGYPTTDETGTPDGSGRFNHFQHGSIYYHPNVGIYEVHGGIRDKWAALGWERSALGYPTTDETGTPDGNGRFNHFQTGSIYYYPGVGIWEVRGAIRDRWAALGWEKSYLGYPTSDEHDWAGLRRSNFQFGYITWNPVTRAVVDRRY